MLFQFDATLDYFRSEERITTLITFATREGIEERDENRNLFLKLGVVLVVTQFQVFVEKVLSEYNFEVKRSNKANDRLPLFLRLQALKLHIEQANIPNVLKNPQTYNSAKLTEIKELVNGLNHMCEDETIIPQHMEIVKKYPMGKQGLNELKDLFKQIEGKDIFENASFDIIKLNEILNRRHNIVHQDSNDQLTEVTVREYKEFIAKVVAHINRYLDINLRRISRD